MKSAKYVVILIIILLSPGLGSSQNHRRPIVIVPGFLGSVLSENGTVVWGHSSSLSPDNFRRLDLLSDVDTHAHLQPTDILRSIPLAFGLMNIGVYAEFIDFLTGDKMWDTKKVMTFMYFRTIGAARTSHPHGSCAPSLKIRSAIDPMI